MLRRCVVGDARSVSRSGLSQSQLEEERRFSESKLGATARYGWWRNDKASRRIKASSSSFVLNGGKSRTPRKIR